MVLFIWMKFFLSEHFSSFTSDFTNQSIKADWVYYLWGFRGFQVKDSPDVTPRQWVIGFRRFESTISLRNIGIQYPSDPVAYHEESPQITFTEWPRKRTFLSVLIENSDRNCSYTSYFMNTIFKQYNAESTAGSATQLAIIHLSLNVRNTVHSKLRQYRKNSS